MQLNSGMTDVACAIIIKDEKVLVTQRSEKMPHPLMWEFPGGKVKEGESPEQCILREISEELGLKIRVEQLLPSVTHEYGIHLIKLIPFICSVKEGEISLTEHKSYRWIPFEEIDSADLLDADVLVAKVLKERIAGGS